MSIFLHKEIVVFVVIYKLLIRRNHTNEVPDSPRLILYYVCT